jgi:hypothetical protein
MKYQLGLASDFSFTPEEIGRFVTARPHDDKHVVDEEIAASIYRAHKEAIKEDA